MTLTITDKTKCNIEGKIFDYDASSSLRNNIAYPEPEFKYLGFGYIYSINGIKQNPIKKFHFWQYIGK